METITEHETLTVRVEHFSAEISISPDTGYRLVKLSSLPKIAGLGGNVRVSRQSANKWVMASRAIFARLRPKGAYPKILNHGIEVLAADCGAAAHILGVSDSKKARFPTAPRLENAHRAICQS